MDKDSQQNSSNFLPLDYLAVKNILKTGMFSDLKGKLENAVFDVKKESPYNFKTQKNIQELCKDVSSFANRNGGFIIFGVSETNDLNRPHQRVSDAVGVIDIDKINTQTYQQHVLNGVYPRLNIEFGQTKFDGLEILYIEIPEGLKGKPYLVKGDNGFWGYYERTDEHSLITEIKQIHEILVKGFQFETQLNTIGEQLDFLVKKATDDENLRSATSSWQNDFKKHL